MIRDCGCPRCCRVSNGRLQHPQRWLALGLGGVARAAQGDRAGGDAQVQQALAQLDEGDGAAGAERAELALASGAAARRRGDLMLAYAHHAQAQAIQRQRGWLGDLGAAIVQAELAQDTLAGRPDFVARNRALDQVAGSIEVFARINPQDARLPALIALRDARGSAYTRPIDPEQSHAPRRLMAASTTHATHASHVDRQ